jgi:DNA-binding response OmpR family regulator
LAMGMDGYATKPISLIELNNEINRIQKAGTLASKSQQLVETSA